MSLEYVHVQRYVRKCLPKCFQRAYNMTIFGLNLKSELNLGLSTSESNQFIFQSLNLVKFTHVICKISCLQTFSKLRPIYARTQAFTDRESPKTECLRRVIASGGIKAGNPIPTRWVVNSLPLKSSLTVSRWQVLNSPCMLLQQQQETHQEMR